MKKSMLIIKKVIQFYAEMGYKI